MVATQQRHLTSRVKDVRSFLCLGPCPFLWGARSLDSWETSIPQTIVLAFVTVWPLAFEEGACDWATVQGSEQTSRFNATLHPLCCVHRFSARLVVCGFAPANENAFYIVHVVLPARPAREVRRERAKCARADRRVPGAPTFIHWLPALAPPVVRTTN